MNCRINKYPIFYVEKIYPQKYLHKLEVNTAYIISIQCVILELQKHQKNKEVKANCYYPRQ